VTRIPRRKETHLNPTARSKGRFPIRAFYLLAVPLVCLSVSAVSQSVAAQSASPGANGQSTISVKTELVLLPVSVTDASGNFISGLNFRNFRVYEDGRLQTLTSFREGDTPVTVGLIVDHSRSMGPKLGEVAAAVSAFASSSNPEDEMFVVDFNDDVAVELMDGKPFSNDPRELAKAVSAVRARGRTALYDAISEGLIHLQLGHWDKKALIIVSDGGDNASQQKYSQILMLAQRSQVTIYSIGLTDPDSENEEENPGVLKRLGKYTGGLAFFPASFGSVADISKTIARDLREQYTLGFVPEKTGTADSFRQIRVKVDAPGQGKIQVRTRPGYFKTEQQQGSAKLGKNPS
jgi:Ca-activated chloride channel family protein